MSAIPMTADDVRNLLIQAVAEEAAIPPEAVPSDQPFTSYGLDSLAALSIGLEIEERCGLDGLPVGLLWDYPTVDALTEVLWRMMSEPTLTTAQEQ
jgi:acyl carrier protein